MQVRQIAYKISIADLLNGQYNKTEGWEPNYILIKDKKISRTNIIGIIISKEDGDFPSYIVDDGTGQISLRFYEGKTFEIGNIINIIGRPRDFNSEIYIVPEIIRLTNEKWFAVHKKQINLTNNNENISNLENNEKIEYKKDNDELEIEEETVESSFNIYETIKKLDKGSGANYEEVVQEINTPNAEQFISKLIQEGEIFEISPGKLKILD